MTLSLAVLALHAAQIPEVGVYQLADWVDPEQDAVGSTFDLSPAFERVLADCPEIIPGKRSVGCSIQVPAGSYIVSRPVELCRRHVIRGRGTNLRGSLTVLQFPSSSGFIMQPNILCTRPGELGGVSTIEDLAIEGPTNSDAAAPTFGVEMYASGRLRNVIVEGFSQGIRVVATIRPENTPDPPANANLFALEYVDVFNAAHAGLYVQGEDVNGGNIIGSNIASNCQFGAQLSDSLGECANVVDRSFLGNTYVGLHTAATKDTAATHRSVIFAGDNARNVCVGCYAEGNQLRGHLSSVAVSVGGLSGWEGTGLRLDGVFTSGFRIQSDDGELLLGRNASPFYMRVKNPANGWTLNLQWNPVVGAYEWAMDDQPAIRILGADGDLLGRTSFPENERNPP